MKVLCIGIMGTVVSLVCSVTAFAQVDHVEIQKALVYLHAKGKVKSGPNASNFVDSFGTGFLVSDDGLVLTVHHLLSELGDVVPQTVTIQATIASKTGTPVNAAIVDASVNTDLMLLKLPPEINKYETVMLGSAKEHNDSKSIYTSGFPKTMTYRMQDGKIQNRSGPGGYLWATSFDYLAGQSGSPVYNDDAIVLGVVKGDENGIGYFIPIGFADALLAQIRLREIRTAMQDFELLRRQFDWSGEVNTTTNKITIMYEKPVGGNPHVDNISLLVKPTGIRGTEIFDKLDFPVNDVKWTALAGQNGRVFELVDVWEAVETLRSTLNLDRIDKVQVDIVPTLSDGTVLRRKRITIEY